jgi:putative ABC transport system ATP-binding protein
MSALLALEGVAKAYTLPSGERLKILGGLDLTVQRGEVVAIVGRSGSGKSTLLNLLGLLDQPDSGSYRCDGVETSALSDARRSRLRGEFFGFIFQQFHLLDRRTALDNVAEPLLFAKKGELSQRHRRAATLLEEVGLSARAQSMPHLLSGGEQQRVAIARALARRPRVLLADEPTGALDETTGERVLNLLLDLVRRENASLILVTHERSVADRADRVLTLTGGRLEDRAE